MGNYIHAHSLQLSCHIGWWFFSALSCGWWMYSTPNAAPNGANKTNK